MPIFIVILAQLFKKLLGDFPPYSFEKHLAKLLERYERCSSLRVCFMRERIWWSCSVYRAFDEYSIVARKDACE
jgi:hypothetical protein